MPTNPGILEYIEAVAHGRRNDPCAVVVRYALRGISSVYKAVLGTYMLPFRMGIRKAYRLERPVISVGNITTGGTGKTPVVQYICRGLVARGRKPAVLSYGYGGKLAGSLGIVSDGLELLLDSATAGDEPRMIAASMPGVPVVVCKHRNESGKTAIDQLGAEVLVLDDGFQVWKLHRDLDIVLVNSVSPMDNGYTLPAGMLREPVSSLRRAGCILVTGECSGDQLASTKARLVALAPGIQIFRATLVADTAYELGDKSEIDLSLVNGLKVLALTSIGNPASFADTLRSIGAVIVATEPFLDHHRYTADDVEYIERRASDCGADIILTTEKDAVKLDSFQFSTRVAVLRASLRLDDETGFWNIIESKIGHSMISLGKTC